MNTHKLISLGLVLPMACLQLSCSNPEFDNDIPQNFSNDPVKQVAGTFDNLNITEKSIGKAIIGMSLDELRQVYSDCTFEERPVHEYGIDGESNGLLVIRGSKPFLFAWTNDGEDRIKGLVAIADNLSTPNGYKVGMTSGEILQKCPQCYVSPDMLDSRIEYVPLPGKEIRLEFLTTDSTRIGHYRYYDAEPKSRILKPDFKVARISIIAGEEMQ